MNAEARPSPWLPALLLLGLAVTVNAPYLGAGFQADDLLLIIQLRQDPLPYSRWMGAWSNWDLPAFTTMWWRDADATGTFWRPVPSLLLEGSVRLFGERTAWPLHLLQLVLHGLVAVGIWGLVRRVLPERPGVALAAGLVFVLCEDHSMGVGWIATITDMLAAAAVMGALHLHLSWMRGRRPAALAGSLALCLVALGSKESAVVVPPLLALTSLLLPDGRDSESPLDAARVRAWLADLAVWLPQVALGVGFLVVYKAAGLGGMRNLMYVDPFGQPVAFAVHAAVHLPIMLLAALTPAPPSLAYFEPHAVPPLALVGAATAACWLALLWPWRHRGLVQWSTAWLLVGLLPQLGSDASERLLYLPFIGGAVLLALPTAVIREAAPLRLKLAAAWTVLGVLAPGAVLTPAMSVVFTDTFAQQRARPLTALPAIEASEPEHVLLLGTQGMFDAFYPNGTLEYFRGEPLDVRVISSFHGALELERLDGDAFALRTTTTGWLSNPFARVVRTDPVLSVGQRWETDLFVATALEVTPDGDDVLAVRFDLARALDDPRVLWLRWDGAAYVPVDLASMAPGERIALTEGRSVWEM